MSAASCYDKITKDELRAELKAMIKQRLDDIGISANDFKANATVRDVTKEQLAVNAAKRRTAAIQTFKLREIAERFKSVEGRSAKINLDAAATLFEFDPRGRFNKFANTDHMERVFLAKMYAALGLDEFRAKWTNALKKVFTGRAFANETREGFDKQGTLAFIKAKLGEPSTPEMMALVKKMDDAYKVGFADNKAAGGKVGWVEHYLPHPYNADEFLARGKPAMVEMFMKAADGNLMKDPITGAAFTEKELRRLAEHTFDSVSSRGRNEIAASPTRIGGLRGSRMNARDVGRTWHFTAEGFMDLMPTFHGNNMFELMLNDMRGLAHDTGFMNVLGPNEMQTINFVKNKLKVATPDADRAFSNVTKFDDLYQTVIGNKDIPYDRFTAQVFSTGRTVVTGLKLQSAFLHSALIGDTMTTFTRLVAKNGMGIGGYLSELTRAFQNKEVDAAWYRSQRFIWDARYYGMLDISRTEGDAAFVKRPINNAVKSTLEASLLERGPMSEIIARQADLMARFTDHADKPFTALPAGHQGLLNEYGVSPAHWDILRSSTKDEATSTNPYKGLDYNKLYATGGGDAADRFQAMLIGEAKATIYTEPTARVSQMLSKLGTRGTITGELGRSAFQFGQWPLLAWRSMMGPIFGDAPIITKAKYGAAVIVSSMMSGYLGMAVTDLLAGQTPPALDDPRTWLAAGMKANLGANYGDMAAKIMGFADPFRLKFGSVRQFQQSLDPAKLFEMSPLLSSLHGGISDISQTIQGKPQAALGDLMHNLGAPFGAQLWFTKTAYERLVVQNLEMMLDPSGYSARQARVTRNMGDRGQSYWLPPAR